ncbi:MtrAB system histidine kinase MtrB [Pseudactinotalea sp. Z1748]|uniref:MtrAB system histidine kinase MtrB n=1 Tax=Pseudactinotalea sp. Z1748 TaxID=3413027 RepID=UPI003C7D9E5A
MAEPTSGWERVRNSRVLGPARALIRVWRSSLWVRVMTTTVVVGLVAVGALGALLSGQVRDGLFEERRDQILADAAARTEAAQERFDSQIASNEQDVQDVALDVVRSLQEGSVGNAGVLLMRGPEAEGPTDLLLPVTDGALAELIEPELREAVRAESFQQWQSVSLPAAVEAGPTPGIAVGSTVTLPIVGEHEIYFIYSLATEAQTLEVLQQVLVVGAVSLILLLVAMAWYLARQVLDPVRVAARTASRLADGRLDERMPVRGGDELGVLGSAFNDMAQSLQDQIERLAELSRMQQRFVSDVSHELRTPLTTIRMAAEVLHSERDSFDPVQARSAELLATQVDRFESLLADLLEISRFDAGSAVLDVEEIDVYRVVERVVEETAPLADGHGSELKLSAPEGDCTADIDPRRVERILRNLLVNAIEHGEGGPIEVQVGANEAAVSVTVRDHGIGMTAPEAKRLFDRFWRADPARTRTLGGTGLGLAISQEDARLHGGTLEAWGIPGDGANFRLTVPRRAGLTVTEHPLALVPERPEVPVSPRHEPEDPAGPATVPRLADHDLEMGR